MATCIQQFIFLNFLFFIRSLGVKPIFNIYTRNTKGQYTNICDIQFYHHDNKTVTHSEIEGIIVNPHK